MVVEDGDGVEGVVEGERGRGRRRQPPDLPLTLGAAVVWRPKDLRALLVVILLLLALLEYACPPRVRKGYFHLGISWDSSLGAVKGMSTRDMYSRTKSAPDLGDLRALDPKKISEQSCKRDLGLSRKRESEP